MSDRAGRNRLDEERSPYLRQHADNPVHWQPWDEAALAEARERDVPIFLSIGYSACHWCHVMEEESFEDAEVAAALNERFVPIKVDREERPDVDSVYMTICQLVTGGGGWPLSAWLTPEGKPFYVGTYFPRESQRGMPGFLDLLERISGSWSDDRDEIENRAEQWSAALDDELEATPEGSGEAPDESILADAAGSALRGADREYGGFGQSGPKFPQSGRIDLLLRAHARTGRDEVLSVATRTLDAMADGGVYDHVGGGFHRYATDREWTVPHFEKMLYDNAELPRTYLAGYQVTGRERYARVVEETFAFVERELAHPDGVDERRSSARRTAPGGGFYSTLDARSEGEEGTFYVWTPEEVREAVDDETSADLFCDRFGVTASGNFEGGTTVLTISESVDSLAEEYGLSTDEVEERLEAARGSVFEARAERPRPARDEKVLASWNGLMISALARGALVLDQTYAETAERALRFVREHLWDGDERRLSRRYMDRDVKGEGFLEDYAFLARGAFDLYGVTGDVDHLAFALDLVEVVVEEFYDAERGTLYFTPESGEALVTRPQELTDRSTPSSLGVAVSTLLDLDAFAPDASFADVAEDVLGTHADRIRGSPLEHVSLVLAAEKAARGSLELTLASDPGDWPAEWRETLAERYLPGVVLAPRPPTEEDLDEWLSALDLDEAPPIWAGRSVRDGDPTVYACEGFACSPPAHELDEALAWFGSDDGGKASLDDADLDFDA